MPHTKNEYDPVITGGRLIQVLRGRAPPRPCGYFKYKKLIVQIQKDEVNI
jgi:hypothetical protein